MKYSLLLSLLLLAGTTCAFSDTLYVSPATQTVYTGQTFTMDIDVDNITDLAAFLFTLTFDPTLTADDFSEGPLFADTGNSLFYFSGPIDNTDGTIPFYDTLLSPPGVDGPGTLATVDFTVIGAGNVSFGFSQVMLQDSDVFLGGQPSASEISVTTTSGTADALTAEPATLYLLATALGLLLLGVWRRSKRGDAKALPF